MSEEQIKNILNNIIGHIDQENINLYKKIIGETELTDIKNPCDFYNKLQYPYDQFLAGFISVEIGEGLDLEFLLLHSNFIERHFHRWIVFLEGQSCSYDKSTTIMNSLFNWFKTGEKITFDYSDQYTFNLPKKVFITHEAIIGFYVALKDLYYGDSKKYLQCLKQFIPGTLTEENS